MFKLKKLYMALLLVFVMVVAAGCGGAKESGDKSKQAQDQKKYVIKFAHVMNTEHPYQKGIEKFKQLIEERTKGQIEVKIYPGAQLGNEDAMLEAYKLGTLEMGVNGSGGFANMVPEVAVLDLGYLFKDGDQAVKVLNGKVGQYISEKLQKDHGIRVLGYFDYGFRHIYSKKEIQKPEDMKGMKIRVMNNKAHIELFKAFGANPTPMGWNEIYTGLQQGVIYGAENNPDTWFTTGHYEVAPVMSMTNHLFLVVGYMISEKFYQSLPPDLQKAVTECAKEAMLYNTKVGLKERDRAIKAVQAKNGKVVEIKDLTPFVNIAKATWLPIAKSVPEGEKLLNMVLEETGQTLK